MRFSLWNSTARSVRLVQRRVAKIFRRGQRSRRGSALILSLVLTVSLAGLVSSAIYMAGNANILATTFDRERDFKYASEAAIAIGKSRLNYDPLVVPDTGYTTILNNSSVTGADGKTIPGVTVNMYIGPTSSNTGQFGRFVSVVTEARDTRGARFVRRLELAQESFAKYAYWTNSETNNGSVIYFGGNDQLWGPVWSNDTIHINSDGGATFHDEVGTAKVISGISYGTFDDGYSQNQRAITLPNNTNLANLPGYAAAGSLSFTAPNSSSVSNALMRVEFVGIDLNGDGLTNGADEGFIRVYKAASSATWLRGDWSNKNDNCGAFYQLWTGGPQVFVPVSEHNKTWLINALSAMNFPNRSSYAGTTLTTTMIQKILTQASARCYPGGDPHLYAVSIRGTTTYNNIVNSSKLSTAAKAQALAGTDTSFVATSTLGSWVKWTGPIDSRIASRADAAYLFPLYRGLNSGTKGVIYVNGTVGISGTLRGRVTLYATGNVAVLDDIQYATDPSLGLCEDILGVIAGNNIYVADNAIQDPQNPGNGYRSFDDTKDVFIDGVLMALNTSFGAENYDTGPTSGDNCDGRVVGRGCLYLTGGIIQQARGAVGTFTSTTGTGYIKRYSYDRCALYNPPPYFPTTGRYTDNRYYEIDPAQFNVADLYSSLTPQH